MNAKGRLQQWFREEVLVRERGLARLFRRHGFQHHEIADLMHDTYEKALIGAAREIPTNSSAYLFTIARNILISRARRAKIISIEFVANIEQMNFEPDLLTPDRHFDAREKLRRVEAALDRLPPRCRDVVRLRKIEGLSTREVAERLGIGSDAVEQQTMFGMRAITDFLMGGTGRIRRPRRSSPRGSRMEQEP